jgi:hypothetical protein
LFQIGIGFTEISAKSILPNAHFQYSDLNLTFEARSHIGLCSVLGTRRRLAVAARCSELVSKPEDSPLRFSLLCTPESSALLDRFMPHVYREKWRYMYREQHKYFMLLKVGKRVSGIIFKI